MHQREAGEHHRQHVDRPLLLDERRVEHRQGRAGSSGRRTWRPPAATCCRPDSANSDRDVHRCALLLLARLGAPLLGMPRALTAARATQSAGRSTGPRQADSLCRRHTMQGGDFGTVTAVLPTCELIRQASSAGQGPPTRRAVEPARPAHSVPGQRVGADRAWSGAPGQASNGRQATGRLSRLRCPWPACGLGRRLAGPVGGV